jgi:NAD(P)-dependent dehydrogenase (short-subunit alcohol dehydrogenase family)
VARLSGKNALITGAGHGIGRASAELFAREGAHVFVADIDESAGAGVANAIAVAGGKATFLPMDVTSQQSVETAIAEIARSAGALHILFNNAGGSSSADNRITEVPIDEFWRVIKVDLFGTWLNCKFAIPLIAASGGGSVINAVSAAAVRAIPGKDAYTAAKSAIAGITVSMALEYAAVKVRVNAIAPGITRTDRLERSGANMRYVQEFLETKQVFGLVEPADIANAALYFASEDSRVTTGQVLIVDGGLTL